MQEIDAERRLAILRGEIPAPLPDAAPVSDDHDRSERRRPPREGGARKRKRIGEDDTDFEMRLARERAEVGGQATSLELVKPPRPTSSVSLVDGKGHISLFSEEDARRSEKNEDAEREAAKKKREFADQYQMRFANAAGKGGQGLTGAGPWYAAPDDPGALVPSKDVFGNEDPQRKVRETARLDSSDPLAMMKRGAAKVRELDRERNREAEERERELRALKREERRREKHRRRREDARDRHESRHERHHHSHSTKRDGSHHDRSRHDRSRHRDGDRREMSRDAEDDRQRQKRQHRPSIDA